MNTIIFFFASYLIFGALVYALYVIIRYRSRTFIPTTFVVTTISFVTWAVCNFFLKNLFAHPRPPVDQALFIPNDLYSFPSGHAAFMFALAFAVYAFVGKGWQVLILLAALTGVARVLAHVHYWYDIVGSFFFSWVLIFCFVWVCGKSKTLKKSLQ